MKKLLIICGLAVLLIGAVGFDAGAALISGSIGFAGKVAPSPDGAGRTVLTPIMDF